MRIATAFLWMKAHPGKSQLSKNDFEGIIIMNYKNRRSNRN